MFLRSCENKWCQKLNGVWLFLSAITYNVPLCMQVGFQHTGICVMGEITIKSIMKIKVFEYVELNKLS